jgi:hypothetical protein
MRIQQYRAAIAQHVHIVALKNGQEILQSPKSQSRSVMLLKGILPLSNVRNGFRSYLVRTS